MTTVTAEQAKWRANVSDIDKRMEAERLWAAYAAADNALWDATESEEFGADTIPPDRGDLIELKAVRDAAKKPWDDFDCSDVCFDEVYDHPWRCALTGLIIHDGDWFLEDENTGERVLKCALGVPLDEGGEFKVAAAQASEAA